MDRFLEKKRAFSLFIVFSIAIFSVYSQQEETWRDYSSIIKKCIYNDYKGMFREEGMALKYPFITPGSSQYSDVLWDWDSWLTNIALRQILLDIGNDKASKEAIEYEQGCILNFLEFGGMDGWIPINIKRESVRAEIQPKEIYKTNMHKPCLAQHAAFLTKLNGGDAEWLRAKFYYLQTFVNN